MRILLFIKWVIIIAGMAASGVLAFPLIMFCNWLSPVRTPQFLERIGRVFRGRLITDFKRARRRPAS